MATSLQTRRGKGELLPERMGGVNKSNVRGEIKEAMKITDLTELEAQCQRKIGKEFTRIVGQHNRWHSHDQPRTKRFKTKTERVEGYIDSLLELYRQSLDYPFWRDKVLTKADEYCVELIRLRMVYE